MKSNERQGQSLKKLKWVASVLLLSVFVGGCGTPPYKVVKAGVDREYIPIWESVSGSQGFRYEKVGPVPILIMSDKDVDFAKKVIKAVADTSKAQGILAMVTYVDAFMQTEDPTKALKDAEILNIGQPISVLAADPKDYGITQTPALLYAPQHKLKIVTGEKEIIKAVTDRYTAIAP